MKTKKYILITHIIICFFSGVIDAQKSSSFILNDKSNFPPNMDPKSWNLITEETFDNSDYNRSKWFARQGHIINNLTSLTGDNNIKVQNGKMKIKIKDHYPSNVNGVRFSSGQFRSGTNLGTNSGNFQNGYFEVRAKLPNGKGFFPAIWLSVQNGTQHKTWPPEIDILEMRGNEQYKFIGTTHCYNTFYHNNDEAYKIIDHQVYKNASGKNLHQAFFTYGLDWTTKSLNWYLNENEIAKYSGCCISQVPLSMVIDLVIDYDHIPNINTTGYLINEPFVIDYIRIYKRNWHYSYWDRTIESGVKDCVVASYDSKKVFYKDDQGGIKGIYWDDNTHSWHYTDWGGVISSGVVDNFVVNSDGTKVFYKNNQGGIKGIYWDDNTHSWHYTDWGGIINSGVIGDFAIDSNGSKLFYRNSQGAIKGMYWDDNTRSWKYTHWGGAANSGVAGDITVNRDGTHVFYRNNQGAIKGIYWDDSSNNWKYTDWSGAASSGVAGDIVVNSDATKIYYKTILGGIEGIYWDSISSKWEHTNCGGTVSSGVDGSLSLNSKGMIFYKNILGGIFAVYNHNGNWYNGALNNVAKYNVDGNISVNNFDQVFYETGGALRGFYYEENNDPLR